MQNNQKYFDENNNLTPKGQEWIENLNKCAAKYSERAKATCYESDAEVAESIKSIKDKDQEFSL